MLVVNKTMQRIYRHQYTEHPRERELIDRLIDWLIQSISIW